MTLEIYATKSLTIDQKLLEYNNAITQWLELEIIRSARENRLDHLHDPSDPLHEPGIDYLIESTIVNFEVTSC